MIACKFIYKTYSPRVTDLFKVALDFPSLALYSHVQKLYWSQAKYIVCLGRSSFLKLIVPLSGNTFSPTETRTFGHTT